jgi:hypothetical protein
MGAPEIRVAIWTAVLIDLDNFPIDGTEVVGLALRNAGWMD